MLYINAKYIRFNAANRSYVSKKGQVLLQSVILNDNSVYSFLSMFKQ